VSDKHLLISLQLTDFFAYFCYPQQLENGPVLKHPGSYKKIEGGEKRKHTILIFLSAPVRSSTRLFLSFADAMFLYPTIILAYLD